MYETLVRELKRRYEMGQSDGDMLPIVFCAGKPTGRIRDGDVVIFACRRGERERQLTEAFVLDEFDHFPRNKLNLTFLTLVSYGEVFRGKVKVVYDFPPLESTLGEVIQNEGLKQLHAAESEKFAHVTFFFNGRRETPFEGEKDVHVKSPDVEDVSKVPQLSVHELADVFVEEIRKGYDFAIVNLANGDVIGHLPDMNAKIECVKHVDRALERITRAALKEDYAVVITSDHGLIELGMLSLDPPVPNLGHTTNPVPLFVLLPNGKVEFLRKEGRLANVAPTILHIMKLDKPLQMDHESLVKVTGSHKVVLIITDGWGIGPADERNPVYLAHPPFWTKLMQGEHATLSASGEDVGLLPGKPGNSEAGHTNIGAGRVVEQEEVLIERDLAEGMFAKGGVFEEAYEVAKSSALHVIAMLSKISSHGIADYAVEIVKEAKARGVKNVYVHFILNRHGVEGVPGAKMLEEYGKAIEDLGGEVVTVMGRKWALDRDRRYDRTEIAYRALVDGREFCAGGDPV